MKLKPTYITAKSLLKILNMASRNPQLGKVTRLYIERQQIREQSSKLRDRRKKNADELKALTTVKTIEQFQFKF